MVGGLQLRLPIMLAHESSIDAHEASRNLAVFVLLIDRDPDKGVRTIAVAHLRVFVFDLLKTGPVKSNSLGTVLAPPRLLRRGMSCPQ